MTHPALTPLAVAKANRRALLASRRPTGPVGKLRASGEKVHLGNTRDDARTADWTFRAADGTHYIRAHAGLRHAADGLNPDLPESIVVAQYRGFARAAIRHETAHARFTERDCPKVAAACREAGVPFRVFNLLEDIRIEAAARAAEGPFHWRRWCALPAETASPIDALYRAKAAEAGKAAPRGATGRVPRYTGPESTVKGLNARGVLSRLHYLAQNAADTLAIVPVAKEFVENFPPPAEWPATTPDPGGEIGEETDGKMPPRKPGEAKPGEAKPGEKPAGPVTPTARWTRDAVGPGHDWRPEPGEDPKDYIGGPPPPDWNLVRRLAARLAAIVHRVGDAGAAVGEEGRSLYVPALAGGDPACWLRRAPDVARPRLCLVVDMSGSMFGLWLEHGGRELVLAFRELARARRIDLRVWLTGSRRACRLPVGAPDKVWASLCPSHGDECFPSTLELAKADLQWARLAVCFSDGCLTDGDVNVSKWRARGVDLVGTCMTPSSESALVAHEAVGRRQFGRYVVAESAPELASRLAVALSRRR